MLKSTNRVAIVFLLIFTFGCKDDKIVEDVNVTVENEFKILPWEALEENNRSFNLNVETIKSESCENTLIDVAPSIVGNNILFTIHDIPEPDCPTPVFIANANVEIGSLDFPQTYEVIVSLKNVIQNEGTLTVESDYYELEMKELNGIVVPETRLYKVPQNTIWGYIASENSNADSVTDGFLDEIVEVSDDQDYIDGYYGYFSVENNNLTILKQNISQSSVRTFGFSYDGDTVDLMDILANYRSQYVNVEFKIFTFKGEEL
ncbi:MAG: hypothetical protein ACJAT4_003027 [Granulosicoccus sp.]|jgi:hypothetical protein